MSHSSIFVKWRRLLFLGEFLKNVRNTQEEEGSNDPSSILSIRMSLSDI
jgi:hypothetical protein